MIKEKSSKLIKQSKIHSKKPVNYKRNLFSTSTNYKFLKSRLQGESVKTSSYQEELKKKSEIAEHKRKESRKDLQHNLIKSFSSFFGNIMKMMVLIYLIGLFFNIFLNQNLNLSKIETIIYTFITITLGILIDRTLLNNEN